MSKRIRSFCLVLPLFGVAGLYAQSAPAPATELAPGESSEVVAEETMSPDTPPVEPSPVAPVMADTGAAPVGNTEASALAPVPKATVVIQAEPTGPAMSMATDTLSVDFPDEEIRNILRNVADLFELNLVIPDTLQGQTSIKLRDVTWRQIFDVTLSPVGYTYVEEGNIIKVISQDTLAQEPVATDVFLINYARADEIKASVEPLIDGAAGGRIVVDARSNALVVTERPSRMGRIRSIIDQLDKATAQVMIESKFIEVTNRDASNIGVNWASLQNYQIGAGQLSSSLTRTADQTKSTGSTNTGTNTSGLTNGSTTTNNFGSNNGSSSSTTVGTVNGLTTTSSSVGTTADISSGSNSLQTNGVTSDVQNVVESLSSLVNARSIGRAATAVFSANDFNLVLSALQTGNETRLVSNPTIVTLNNTEAEINIGEEFPIPQYTYNAERGTFEVSGFDYRTIGIILKVVPQVNSQGFIKLTIQPEVSSRSGSANFNGAEIPIVTTRKTNTQVSLRDGYTMGIGGLIQNTISNGQTKVPILGSIPGLGRLFRSDSKSDDTQNLLIFITARTVSPEGAPIEDVFDPRAIRRMRLDRDDLPGYRESGDPFTSPEVSDAAATKKKHK